MPYKLHLTRVAVGLLASCVWTTGFAQETIQFNRDIRPILSENCFECHGPDAGTREADLRLDREQDPHGDSHQKLIVPGQPEKSELFLRISSTDPDLRMPPADFEKTLTEEQIDKVRQWIASGATWQQHWAFIPPTRSSVPDVSDDQGNRLNAIDHFVLQRVRAAGLQPADPADPIVLVRRLCFDLLGLPPSIEEVSEYTSDPSDVAYEAVVDRLLESPHFGERMAMYWLDVARFADSNGYHSDEPREIAPFRDYVIQAFHQNKPFNEFVIEQLAGDLLPEAGMDQKVASGFNMLLQTTSEGGAQAKEYLAKYMADRVRNTSSIFLGVTLGCAECHDHKFDPFSTHDFYSMGAFFADIQEKGVGNPPTHLILSADQEQQLADINQRDQKIEQQLNQMTPELVESRKSWESTWLADNQETTASSIILEPWYQFGTIPQPQGNRNRNRLFEFVFPPELEFNPTKTYSSGSWQQVEQFEDGKVHTLPGGPGTAYLFRRIYAERTLVTELSLGGRDHLGAWLNGARVFEDRSANPAKPDEHTASVMLREGENQLLLKLVTGKNNIEFYFGLTPHKLPDNVAEIVRRPTSERNEEQVTSLDNFFLSITPDLLPLRRTRADLQRKKYQLQYAPNAKRTLMTVATSPRKIRVLPRGNWLDDSGQEVGPRVPSGLNSLDVGDRLATRIDLARWMVASDNPLTARVFTNRLWKLFFGRGLATPLDDLGAQGTAPTHPELLDWLAIEFMESGWDVKHMVKLMVMSSTYRQSSSVTQIAQQQDPYNELYARQARFRLDAEMVRDNALAISGLLVRQIGGRSVRPYQPAGYWRHMNFPKRSWQLDAGAQLYRRGLYTWWQRMFLHPAMVAFDAPSREECTVERPRSNTPLQALVLLNDDTYVEAARVFAERVLREGGSSFDERLTWAMRRALSREPGEEELITLKEIFHVHQQQYQQDVEAAKALISTGKSPVPTDLDPADTAAWTSVTRVLLNLHESITRT